MKSINVIELPNLILNRLGFVLFDDILNLLHFDRSKGPKVFESLIHNSLVEYAKYYPIQQLSRSLPGGNTQWDLSKDNFDAYLSGRVSEKYIYLRPYGIYFMKNGSATGSYVSTQWWDYDNINGMLYCRQIISSPYIEYFSNRYPTKITIGPDNNFTEDSKIYYLDINDDVIYLDYLIYYVIRQIRLVQSSINLGQNIQLLSNLDVIFSEFEQIIQTHKDNRSDILRMWRK